MKKCRVDGCEKEYSCKGYCAMHYMRVKTNGDPGPIESLVSLKEISKCAKEGCDGIMHAKSLCRKHYVKQYIPPNKCSIEGCDKSLYANSYCQMHWQRTRKHNGDPGIAGRIRNEDGLPVLDKNGYRIIKFDIAGKIVRVLEHRYIMEQHLGRKLFPKENIHHINGDRADNRIENLELWNTSQPSGQRIEDKIKWAKELLLQYGEIINYSKNSN